MDRRRPGLAVSIILFLLLIMLTLEAKTIDPYKVLEVDRNASQRDIQKAFHRLSLLYHPDKNKSKGAQAKFAEINNAYEILSDEEKRKNYDLYGDDKGNPGFDGSYPGNQDGYTYFSRGGPGESWSSFRPGEGPNMGGQGGSRSFSFSFGGPSSQSSFGFDLGDIFSNFFGGNTGGQFGSFSGSTQSGSRSSPKRMKAISSQVFKKDIADQGITWILLSYTPSLRGTQHYESIIHEVASSLEGAVKVGSINCESEVSFCKELGIHPRREPRVLVYYYKSSDKGSLVEYNGDLVGKNLKSFFQDHLPRFSKRIDLKDLESSSERGEKLPRVLLLSTKRETPLIWRVLSGLYRKRFTFNDIQVHDVADPIVKKLGVDALPAIVGWLSNGEKHVLKAGISVKDLKSTIHDLSELLDDFEKKNKKAASSQTRKPASDSVEKQVPLLTGSNFDAVCGETSPVCIVGAFRSSKAREKLESILSVISDNRKSWNGHFINYKELVSQKSLSRRQSSTSGQRDSVSYAVLDAAKQRSFLNAFDKSGYKSSDKLLIAYKPRRGKFAAFEGELSIEEVERFVSSVLNGDIQFSKIRQKPVVKRDW